ncbi:MAG: secondary thiamine-phosphate synthase enzyme YjbQ [Erysipelotrichaceae bacterium]|nr:secondary thiamine-phosphate synthase enzyme YjbQ [Erysipelotrichaceae bacterium]
MAYMETIKLHTDYQGMHDVTGEVQDVVKKSGIEEGICVINCNHTTAGIIITSFWDKRGHVDFQEELDKLIPMRYDYLHDFDTPTDAAGHIKSAICGTGMTLIVHEGKAMLGSSQGVLFCEFDGPRDRKFFVKVIAD